MATDERDLTYYRARDEGALPSSARHPWTAFGSGFTLSNGGVLITAAAAANGYLRQLARPAPEDRMELQLEFQLRTNTPGWASGVGGHVLAIDDGERAVGVSIGSTIELVDPSDGSVIAEIPQSAQPGGATQRRSYLLIKDGTSAWEIWVDGRLVKSIPYVAGAPATYSVATWRWGWLDASGSGIGLWDRVETGLNETLPPNWKVDRARRAIAAPLQAEWTHRHEAMLRAAVGLAHQTQDKEARLWARFTAAVDAVQSAAFEGDASPTNTGWTIGGDAGSVSIVRERVAIAGSSSPTYAQYTWDTPVNTDGVFRAAARFTVRAVDTSDPAGRLGPYLTIEDGNRQLGAFLCRDLGNPDQAFWVLSDAAPSAATLGNTGNVRMPANAYRETLVELFVIGRERVLLFVDGAIVEDVLYSTFVTSSSNYRVRIGRDGSSVLDCDAEISDAAAAVAYGDNAYRPLFLRRIAERLVFSAGCERNDVLDVWLRHREGVFAARGTDRVLSELRRLACDDDAELVQDLYPGDWYLGVTYPGVTPVFLASGGFTTHVRAEFRSNAPNFTAAQLERLIERYLLPTSAIDMPTDAALTTDLTSSTSTVSGETQFSVASLDGFAVGDPVTLRGPSSGTLLSIDFDSDEGLTALAAATVRDFSGRDEHAALTNAGADATIGNTAAPALDGVVIPNDASAGDMEGILATGQAPTLSGGFTVAGWFRNDIAHDGTSWVLGATDHGIGTGGYIWQWASGGGMVAAVYDGSGSVTLPGFAHAPAAGTWTHLALRWDAGSGTLTMWRNGAPADIQVNGAFTMLDPGTTDIGFGCDDAGAARWKGQHRDHLLFERALSDVEMAALPGLTTGREPIRSDADLFLSYLPSGYPAILATHTGDPLVADYVLIGVDDGWAWASWELVSKGRAADEIYGEISFAGLNGAKLANITPGATVTVSGNLGAIDTWAEVFGIDNGTGLPVSERLRVDGTTPAESVTEWAEVHGFIIDNAGPGIVTLAETGGASLFTIASTFRASGVHLYEPPLLLVPSVLELVADGAATNDLIPWGVEEGALDGGEEITMNGTTPVLGSRIFASIRAIAAGYIAAARTVTLTAVLAEQEGDVTIVSSSASDTQRARVVAIGVDGVADLFEADLDGTTPVTLGSGVRHVLGVLLDDPAVGTVTVSIAGGAATVEVATIAAGEYTAGVDRRRVGNVGAVYAELADAQASPVFIGVFGVDDDGGSLVDVWSLSSTARTYGTVEFSEIHGFAVGAVPTDTSVRFGGTSWRARSPQHVATDLVDEKGWTASGPTSVLALDGRLDDAADLDATLDTVDLSGTWSDTEDTTISSVVSGTTIRTTLISGSFTSSAVMRRGA